MSLNESQRVSAGAAAGIAVFALLLLGWVQALPGTPNYYDVVMYLDAAQRIGAGQTPHADFFLPFGALSAYLFALVKGVFPHVQPVLGAQYALLLIAIPAMLAATWRTNSVHQIAWLWAGFALFALLPANFLTFPEPFLPSGVDGHGIYNRQAGLLLYVLVSALLYAEDRVIAAILSGVLFIAIAFIKITALVVAAPMIALALVAGRVEWRSLLIVFVLGFAMVLALEWSTKLVSGYLADMSVFTASSGEAGLIKRLMGSAASAFLTDFVGAMCLGIAGAALAWREWAMPDKPDERVWLRNAGIGLLLLLSAALLGESQNTGTQALAFLTPVALKIAAENWDARGAARIASVCAIVFIGLTAGAALYKGARLVKSAFESEAIGPQDLGLSASPEEAAAAQAWLDLQTKSAWSEREALLYEQIDKLDAMLPLAAPAYALAAQQMVEGMEDRQATSGAPVASIATLDFVDPAPALLNAPSLPGLPVIYDPERLDFTERAATMQEALTQAEIILAPMCGPRFASVNYAKLVAGALQGRQRSRLNACWAVFTR